MRVLAALLVVSAISFCAADSDGESINQAGQTIQKLLNERIGKKIVEAAKEVKGILSKSLGKHVKKATAKLILDSAVDQLNQQVKPTQNDGVAKVGTDQTEDDCVKDCKLKKLAKQGKAGKPKIHHVQSMHKGAPSHRTPHNKGPRNRKNMPGPGLPTPPVQDLSQQQQPPPPNPTMPQAPPPQAECAPQCPAACAPACTQDCCRPMLSLMQLPAAPPPYYPPPPPPMCAPPCTQPSCAPACPPACCTPPPPPPPPPPPACPPVCVQHCYTICPRGCCRAQIPHKKHHISHTKQEKDEFEVADDENEEEESSSIISDRKSSGAESNPMERNKIPREKPSSYKAAV